MAVRWDRDASGAKSDRPGYLRAVHDTCAVKGRILVVFKLDRLSRSISDAWKLLMQIEAAGCSIAFLAEQINTRGSIGKVVYTVVAWAAELEREAIRERTRSAMIQHQKNGRRMGRLDRVPFGKQPDLAGPMKIDAAGTARPARMIDNPIEQATLLRMKELRAAGKGWKAIVTALNAEGRHAREGIWYGATIKRILARA